jgi:DNA repair exonuclease SbcCD ATPase subunit
VLKIARRKLEDFAKFAEGDRNVHKRIKEWAKELPSLQKRVASEYLEMKEVLDDTKYRLEAEREEHKRKYMALAAKCEALRRESEEARTATCSSCSKCLGRKRN